MQRLVVGYVGLDGFSEFMEGVVDVNDWCFDGIVDVLVQW